MSREQPARSAGAAHRNPLRSVEFSRSRHSPIAAMMFGSLGAPHEAWSSLRLRERPKSRLYSSWQIRQKVSYSVDDILYGQSGENHAENTSDDIYARYAESFDNAHCK